MAKRDSGFTLIELMIAVVVVAILASIAVPAYQGAMQKSRRSDAISALLSLQLEQEKFRASCTQYASAIAASDTCDPGGGTFQVAFTTTSTEGHYNLSINSAGSTSFTATAAPVSGGAQDGDDCGTFAIDQDGPITDNASYADARCWGK